MAQPIDRGHQHTNASLRALLGEAGYLIASTPARSLPGESTWQMWSRGSDVIWFVVYPDKSPELRERKTPFNIIDPKTLGVRNPNIQTGEKP